MPTATCSGCGRLTNSATSNYWFNDRQVTRCKAAFVDGCWVPGCDYGTDTYDEAMYGDMFNKPAKEAIDDDE